jgi:hypothetical protein
LWALLPVAETSSGAGSRRRERAGGPKRRLRQAWALEDHDQAIDRLHALAVELERGHPGVAGSLREGLAETLAVARLGITGSLKRTLASTNPCESMIECVRRTSRNVKRWLPPPACPTKVPLLPSAPCLNTA